MALRLFIVFSLHILETSFSIEHTSLSNMHTKANLKIMKPCLLRNRLGLFGSNILPLRAKSQRYTTVGKAKCIIPKSVSTLR